jgi:hypothetical protein
METNCNSNTLPNLLIGGIDPAIFSRLGDKLRQLHTDIDIIRRLSEDEACFIYEIPSCTEAIAKLKQRIKALNRLYAHLADRRLDKLYPTPKIQTI